MNAIIRPYRPADLDAVARIFTESVHELARHHYDADQRAAWAPRVPDLDGWAKRLSGCTTLVADLAGSLVGFISYEHDGHLDLLFVAPSFARQGVASLLYDQAESDLIHSGVSTLSTEASLVAQPFFMRKGFIVMEEQQVERRGVTLRRFSMRKLLDSRAR